LLFRSEVAAAMGGDIEFDQDLGTARDEAGWLSECIYWRHQFLDVAPLDVTVASGPAYSATFEDLRGATDTSPVAGVGDEAFVYLRQVWGLDGPVAALVARTGGAVILLSLGIADQTVDGALVLAGDTPSQQQILVNLATTAIGRLTGPPEPAAQVCKLLPLADAAALLGKTLTQAKDVDEHDQWDPSCHYEGSDSYGSGNFIELFVSVEQSGTGQSNFDACKSSGEAVPGLGDEAIFARSGCTIRVGLIDSFGTPLLVHGGDTVIVVGMRDSGARATMQEVARRLLAALGIASGPTPAPTAFDILSHPCALVTAEQVSSIMREVITETTERGVTVNGPGGGCQYSTTAGNLYPPLTVGITVGDADERWPTVGSLGKEDQVPLPGLGDEAFSETFPPDPPFDSTVRIYIRRGETILQLFSDAVPASDGRWLAAGTPEEQLQMLIKLAELILPQVPQ
jgi:hypothetical protein